MTCSAVTLNLCYLRRQIYSCVTLVLFICIWTCSLISMWTFKAYFSAVRVWNVDKSHWRRKADLGRTLIEGVKKVKAKEKETKLSRCMTCSWEKGRSLCENCHSGRESPTARARSDDALAWYVTFSPRKLPVTFCVPNYRLKLDLAQKKKKKRNLLKFLGLFAFSTFWWCCKPARMLVGDFSCWRTLCTRADSHRLFGWSNPRPCMVSPITGATLLPDPLTITRVTS